MKWFVKFVCVTAFLLVWGCDSPDGSEGEDGLNGGEEPSGLAPNDLAPESKIEYLSDRRDVHCTDECEVSVSVCDMIGNSSGALIVKIISKSDPIFPNSECTGPYVRGAYEYEVEVVGGLNNSMGQPGDSLTLVEVSDRYVTPDNRREEGEMMLAFVRSSYVENFILESVEVNINNVETSVPFNGFDSYDLPGTYGELDMLIQDSFGGGCEMNNFMSDEDFNQYIHTPGEECITQEEADEWNNSRDSSESDVEESDPGG